MRSIAPLLLLIALSGIGFAADPAPSPIAPAELQVFLPVVLPALKPDEQAALGQEMQTAGTADALAAVVTKYALVVQGRGTKLPHPVAATAPTAASPVVPAKPASTTVAELPGARPITADEIHDFNDVMTDEMFKLGIRDAFVTELEKARTLEAQVAIMNKYAAKLQARGVKLPHPVLADGSVPPLPGASSVVQDPEGRVPTKLDPAWEVVTYDGDDNAVWNITKKVGQRIHLTYYDTAGFRQSDETFPDGGRTDDTSDDPQYWRVLRNWTQNQHLKDLDIAGLRRYHLPASSHPAHPLYNTKQVIIWNDPKDQLKGIKAAGSLPLTEADGSTAYIGTWIAWNERAREVEKGPMEKGVRTGTWIECTFVGAKGKDSEPTTEATGVYIDGKKSGTWTIKLGDEHPEAVKAVDEARKTGKVSIGVTEGFLIEQIYESGKVVKETRNF